MSEQAIPADILDTAHDVAFDCDPSKSADQIADNIARALFAERQKHDLPTSPDLQAEAERVFADVQRVVLVEDAKAVIAKALQARDERAAQMAEAESARWKGCGNVQGDGYGDGARNATFKLAGDIRKTGA